MPLVSPLPAGHRRIMLSGSSSNSDTAATIDQMQNLVTRHKRDFEIRKLIKQFIFNCPPKNYYCYVQAAHNFCRDQIRYVFDPNGVELIENPVRILESRVADCDSIVVLMASLCEQMGFPCRFVTIRADKQRPGDFTHVFLEVKVPGRGWVGSDPTQPEREFGWKPGPEYARKTWPASKDMGEAGRESDEMAGMGFFDDPDLVGVQTTPGVIVEKAWQWRDEPRLITATPDQMELQPFISGEGIPVTPPIMPGNSFVYADQAQQIFDEHETNFPSVTTHLPAKMTMRAVAPTTLGQFSSIPKWAWLAGAAALFLLLRKK